MRAEARNDRDPGALRSLPFCSALVVYGDLTPYHEAAVNADRALIGLPPVSLKDPEP